ncbi:hypothetical protein DE171_003377 [Clostridium beijerinckii]|nr:hypothetical protein [Clostridium beijerinckii]NYC50870.1 hypothetical protein [Clostridium beijerinckii]
MNDFQIMDLKMDKEIHFMNDKIFFSGKIIKKMGQIHWSNDF